MSYFLIYVCAPVHYLSSPSWSSNYSNSSGNHSRQLFQIITFFLLILYLFIPLFSTIKNLRHNMATYSNAFLVDSMEEGEILENMNYKVVEAEERKTLERRGHMAADFLNQLYPTDLGDLSGEEMDISVPSHITIPDHCEIIAIESTEEGEIFEPRIYHKTAIKIESSEGKAFKQKECRAIKSIKVVTPDLREFEWVNHMDTSVVNEPGFIVPESPEGPKKVELMDLSRQSSSDDSKYEQIRKIGQGGEASCFLSKRHSDQTLLVCKVYPEYRAEQDGGLPREVIILKDYLPPYDRIVHFHEATLTRGMTNVYFDYYAGGDLENLIYNYADRRVQVPESFIWHAFLQLSEALAYIHLGYDRHVKSPISPDWWTVVHRDIKPSNVLLRLPTYNFNAQDITDIPYPSLVLADFGLASIEETTHYYLGSYMWQPPEIPEASCAADCWALGACIHAMALQGDPPIKPFPKNLRRTRKTRARWFRDPNARGPRDITRFYSQHLQDCISSAFVVDPWRRANALQLLDSATRYAKRPALAKVRWEPLAPWAFVSSHPAPWAF